MIGAGEHEHAGALGNRTGEREREQVCFGSRSCRNDEIDRREPRAHRLRERSLVPVRRAEHDTVHECLTDRLHDHRMRMAVQPRGVLAEKVDVLVPVSVTMRAPSPRTIVSGNGG